MHVAVILDPSISPPEYDQSQNRISVNGSSSCILTQDDFPSSRSPKVVGYGEKPLGYSWQGCVSEVIVLKRMVGPELTAG